MSGLSLAGTLFQLAVTAGMARPEWSSRGSVPQGAYWGEYVLSLPRLWAPHMENPGEGTLAFPGPRCPGSQQIGTPFRIDEWPLPEDYDPFAFPGSDVIACVRLDSDGIVRKARLAGGTGSSALDRRLLRALFREWRFVPVDPGGAARGWQRIRLNSGRSPARLPRVARPRDRAG